MAIKVGEFLVELVVDAASGNLSVKQLIANMGELEVTSLGGTYGIAKLAEKLYDLAHAATETSVNLENLHELTGVDPHKVLQWQQMGERIKGSQMDVLGLFKSVNDQLAKIRVSGGTTTLLETFGIDPNQIKDAGDLIETLFKRMQERPDLKALSPGERAAFMDMFPNVDDVNMILDAMQKGRWKPETISALNDSQMKNLSEIEKTSIAIRQGMVNIADHLLEDGGVLLSVLKTAQQLIQDVDDWVVKHHPMSAVRGAYESTKDFLEDQFAGRSFITGQMAMAMGRERSIFLPTNDIKKRLEGDFEFYHKVMIQDSRGNTVGGTEARQRIRRAIDDASVPANTEGAPSEALAQP